MNLGAIWGDLNKHDISFIGACILYKDDKYFGIVYFKKHYLYPFIPLNIIEESLINELKWMENLSNKSSYLVYGRNEIKIDRAYKILKYIKNAKTFDFNYNIMPG